MPAHNSKKTNPHKINVLSAAISLALFPFTTHLHAQTNADSPHQEEVAVTGSRITRFEGDYVAPVLSLGAEQMAQSGKVNIEDYVSEVAALLDTNTIPTALIERVDILTGGASAVYGADAVSGAVNFVLKDDFEGFLMRSQGGISGHGDAEEYFAFFVWGSNFANGRGNITSSFEYRK